jgi:hypothetical protein
MIISRKRLENEKRRDHEIGSRVAETELSARITAG